MHSFGNDFVSALSTGLTTHLPALSFSQSIGLVYHPPPFHTRSVLIKGTVREYRKTRNTYRRASKKYSNLYHIVILSASTENAALFWYSQASRTHLFSLSLSVCLECYSGCSMLYPSSLHTVNQCCGSGSESGSTGPMDPYVFGPPGSGSGSTNQRYGSGSGSF